MRNSADARPCAISPGSRAPRWRRWMHCWSRSAWPMPWIDGPRPHCHPGSLPVGRPPAPAGHQHHPLLACVAGSRSAYQPRGDPRPWSPAGGRQSGQPARRCRPAGGDPRQWAETERAVAATLARRRPSSPLGRRRWRRSGRDQRPQARPAAPVARRGRGTGHRHPPAFAGGSVPALHGPGREHSGRGGCGMTQIWNIARKELSDGLRNRWLLAISLLFAVLAVGIAWLGAAASGQLGFTSIPATIASLASLATFLVPLIALLLAYDAIVGEDEAGTLMLLLTYPLGRGQLLLGKFVGHGLILALATLIGFGCAALAIALLVEDVELGL